MTQHKWHKEIKAWADGADIEARQKDNNNQWGEWYSVDSPQWYTPETKEYRIKPQPKEPKYLYVYQMGGKMELAPIRRDLLNFICGDREIPFAYIGKIKLEEE